MSHLLCTINSKVAEYKIKFEMIRMPKVIEHSTFHLISFFWRIARPCMDIYDFLILNRQNGGSSATECESTCAKMAAQATADEW